MKPTVVLSLFLMCFFTSFAGKSELFDIDEVALSQEFNALNELEEYVSNNAGVTYSVLLAGENSLVSDLTLNYNNAFHTGRAFSIDTMDWGAFAWGFLCCPVGFFVVAINDTKDRDQKASYWIGVGVSTVLGAIINLTALAAN